MPSSNPADWTFAISPYGDDEEGPTAFLSPKDQPDFDQECHSYLTQVFDGLEQAGLEGYECMECHIELTNRGATVSQLRDYLVSHGMTEQRWPD